VPLIPLKHTGGVRTGHAGGVRTGHAGGVRTDRSLW